MEIATSPEGGFDQGIPKGNGASSLPFLSSTSLANARGFLQAPEGAGHTHLRQDHATIAIPSVSSNNTSG